MALSPCCPSPHLLAPNHGSSDFTLIEGNYVNQGFCGRAVGTLGRSTGSVISVFLQAHTINTLLCY